MLVNAAKIYSTLGNPNSLVPLGVKDASSCLGMTAGSYATGKEEGFDRFIDEFGTEALWLGGIPAFKWPDTSSLLAPSGVRNPAFSPAGKTLGRISVSFQGYPLGATNLSNLAIIPAE